MKRPKAGDFGYAWQRTSHARRAGILIVAGVQVPAGFPCPRHPHPRGRSMNRLGILILKSCVALMFTIAGCVTAAEVAEVSVDRSPTPPETAAIKRALGTSYAEMSPFTVGHADLDGDRKPDLLFRSGNSDYCGSGGCATGVLLATTSSYRHESIDLAYSNGAVIVLPAVHQGMHDLRFEGGNHLFSWNGANYE